MIKWLCYKIISIGSRYGETESRRDSLPVVTEDHLPDMEKAVRFSVLSARGGCVLETRTFDKKEREWDVVSHVIPEGTDVAKQVGDIVAMEMLRR